MTVIARIEGAYSETEIQEEIVVMNLANGGFFSLTGTARTIWLLIDGTRNRGALLAELAGEFEDDSAAIAADVDSFLDQLSSAGLIGGR